MGWPILGSDLRLLGEDGVEITEPFKEGIVCCKLPGPLTLPTTIWGDEQGYID
jgi:hypothetical protein